MDLTGKTLLVTGGTGSFGTAFIRTVLARYDVAAIRVFSRDDCIRASLVHTTFILQSNSSQQSS